MSSVPGFGPSWPAPPSVRAWVTERGSPARYGSLNLATHVGDDPEAVAENRARLRAALDLPAEPHWLTQVHGTRVVDLDREAAGAADGAVTARFGVVCAVMTADCLPVLLCDRAGSRVGVAYFLIAVLVPVVVLFVLKVDPTAKGAGSWAPSAVMWGIAAGAALQVVVEVGRYVARTAPGGLRSGWVIGGYLAGIAAMWATGLLVG